MVLHNIFQILMLLLTAVTSQFMPQMSQMAPIAHMPQMSPMGHFPFYPPQAHSMQMQMPGSLPGGMPPMIPGMPHLPGMRPPIQMSPMQLPLNTNGRLPMVVMPHHTKKKGNKKKSKRTKKHGRKRAKILLSSSSEDDSDSSFELNFRRNNDVKSERSRRKGREVLTPVVSYVTKEGYVIYQKKIKKDKAKDWLEMTNDLGGKLSRGDVAYDHDHHDHHRH